MTVERAAALVGVKPGASDQQIRAAHRRAARAVHPDLHDGTGTARMVELRSVR